MAEEFDGDWLDLREPHDAAARDPGLAAMLSAALPARPRVLDLGAGTGSLLRWLGLPLVLLGAAVGMTNFSPDPVSVPEPKLFFTFDKTFLSPARLLHGLALAAVFAGLFKTLSRFAPQPAHYLCLLGRNSLIVFCALSLLSLGGQILRYACGGTIALDSFIVIFGVFLMGVIAWAGEGRDRLRLELSKRQPVPPQSPGP